MRRLVPLLLCSTLLPLGGCSRPGPEVSAPRQPSLLLITIETLRADHLPFYGYERDTAPFLTSIRESSTLFTRAHSTSSWTVPALASMLTGVYPHTHGVVHGVTRQDRPHSQEVIPEGLGSVAVVLHDLGYATYAVVANTHAHEDFGFARGFERYREVGFVPAEEVNRVVLEWREEIEASERPVFLWLHYFDPHYPLHTREPWAGRYQPDLSATDVTAVVDLAEGWREMPERERSNLDSRLTTARTLYDSEINYADDAVRRLFDTLPELHGWFTIITSDHGEEFVEHGDLGHSFNLHNETVRIPMLVRDPGSPGPATSSAMVSLLDVPSTLVVASGGEVPASWQGEPLVDADRAVRDDIPEDRQVLAFLDRFPGRLQRRALIGDRWKLITGREPGSRWLYDLQADPAETADLARVQAGQADQLVELLHGRLLSMPTPPAVPEEVELTADQQEALRALGYVED